MQINGPAHIHGSPSVSGPQRMGQAEATEASDKIHQTSLHEADQVDISPEAEMVSRVHEMPDVRADRIDAIRQEISAGTYDTDEKMDIALGRMFDELAG